MKIEHARKIRRLGWMIFIVYLIFLVYLMFFAEGFGRAAGSRHIYSYNLTPFKEIKRFVYYADTLGMVSVLLNLGGNVIGFIPIGLIPPIINRRNRNIFWMVFCGFSGSLFIEISQLIFKVGSFDVDDIILNTFGTLLGYIVFMISNRLRRKYYG